MSFLRESLATFGTRMLLVLANLPISILIFRRLGPEGQSIYSSATSYATSCVVIGLLGIDAAHTYLLAGRRAPAGRLLANSAVALAALSLLMMPLFPPLIAYATRGEGNALHPYLPLAALTIPIIGARYLLLSVFMAHRRLDAFNLIYVASDLLLLALLLAGLCGAGAGAGWALWAFVLSQVAMVLAAGCWVWRRERPAPSETRPSWPLLRTAIGYGLRGLLGAVLTTFVYRFDTILVLRWLGAAAQGQYFVAVFLAEKLTHITASVQAVLFPRVSASTTAEADRLTPRVCRHTLLWVTLAGAALFALADLLLSAFYSSEAAAAVAPMRILLPGVGLLTVSKLLSADLSGRDRRFMPTLFMALALAVNIGLNLLWTRRHGIAGAAWASTIAYGLQALLMTVYFQRVTGVRPRDLLVPGRADLEAYIGLLRRLRARRAARGSRAPAE